MPEYFFAVRRSDQEHLDERATALNDNAAALDYACHMARELRAKGGSLSGRLLLRTPTWPVRRCHANRLEPPANADYLFRPDSADRALSEDQNHRRVVEEFKGHAADLKAVLGRGGQDDAA